MRGLGSFLALYARVGCKAASAFIVLTLITAAPAAAAIFRLSQRSQTTSGARESTQPSHAVEQLTRNSQPGANFEHTSSVAEQLDGHPISGRRPASAGARTSAGPRRRGGGRDVEALRRAFEAQLAAQEQRHAAELRAAHGGMVRRARPRSRRGRRDASRTRGPTNGRQDVFAGPSTGGGGRRGGGARRGARADRRHDAYAVDLCLVEHAWAAQDWGRAWPAARL